MRAAFVASLCSFAAACVSGNPRQDVDSSVDGEFDSSGTKMLIVSGDGQNVAEHKAVDLIVSVTDAASKPLSGVPVTFVAAPGSAFQLSSATQTGYDGIAGRTQYFHVSGQVQVVAESPGLPAVTFTLQVTPSTHTYDGVYDTSGLDQPGYAVPELIIESGLISTPMWDGQPCHGVQSAMLDESTGQLSATVGFTCDMRAVLSGQLTVDSQNQATGAGTYANSVVATETGSGNWTATRR